MRLRDGSVVLLQSLRPTVTLCSLLLSRPRISTTSVRFTSSVPTTPPQLNEAPGLPHTFGTSSPITSMASRRTTLLPRLRLLRNFVLSLNGPRGTFRYVTNCFSVPSMLQSLCTLHFRATRVSSISPQMSSPSPVQETRPTVTV